VRPLSLLLLCSLLLLIFPSLSTGQHDSGADARHPFITDEIPVASTRCAIGLRNYSGYMLQWAQRIEAALKSASYSEQGWFLVVQQGAYVSGVAVMTRIERFRSDGTTEPGTYRFSLSFNPRIESISDYFRAMLVEEPKGHYRSFLIVLTDPSYPQQRQMPEQPPTEAQFVFMYNGAARREPAFEELRNLGVPSDIYAYVYEFQKGRDDQELVFVREPVLDAATQLKRAGILDQLQASKMELR
jgi:hypothetical protein